MPPDQAWPEQGDTDAEADAHAALLKAEAELRRLREKFAELHGTGKVLAESAKLSEQLIAQKDRTIQAQSLTIAQERGRRLAPKSARRSGGRG